MGLFRLMVNWRDIQEQAEKFVINYANAKDEDRDAKPFWKDLLEMYGVDPRQMGAFEERVRIHGRPGVARIDYFAPRKFIIEHKSLGKDLDAAYRQAMDYFDALQKSERPQYIIVSDFANFRIYNLEADESSRLTEFALEELPKRIQALAFFADEEVRVYKPEEIIDVKAVRAIGKLHAALKAANYTPTHIAPFLTRIVFLCFADDTGIFENGSILRYLEENTKTDGSDIGSHLNAIFEVLNTDIPNRQKSLHSSLGNLPYVNGGLFAQSLNVVFASRDIRDGLIKCMEFDWSGISPAVFGSMFQSVMDERERHDRGAHYTSEANILKVVNGLFLEDLLEELNDAKSNKDRLMVLHEKIAKITLLDPACGCGNFLVISYREIRRIENEIISRIYRQGSTRVEAGHMLLPMSVDIKKLSKLSVENMYGIEIDPFAAEVAKLSLWLMDHLMNVELGKLFGEPYKKLPLTEAPHIVQSNALQLDWEAVVPKDKLSFILGNPPFLGKSTQDKLQKADLLSVFGNIKSAGDLDFVAAWYRKAVDYMTGTTIRSAFVSTNSITQGEQVDILWTPLLAEGVHIHFAHRTFKWNNEASGKAAVYCVIIGFGFTNPTLPMIFEYKDVQGEPEMKPAKNINPYLVNAPNVVAKSRRHPISAVHEMMYGSKPADGGFLILSEEERQKVDDKIAIKYIRPLLSAHEYLNGDKRWCLWLVDASPADMNESSFISKQIAAVRANRELSTKDATRRLANTPYLFAEIRQPKSDFILVPRHSSESRTYVPLSFFNAEYIVSDSCAAVPSATPYEFGIMQSAMHMTWMRAVCGRIKSDYRYSNELVYNNFPWPNEVNVAQKSAVEEAVRSILEERVKYMDSSLAHLYDPNTMPIDLLKAHQALDRAVDACYGRNTLSTESVRLELLFELYQKLILSESK